MLAKTIQRLQRKAKSNDGQFDKQTLVAQKLLQPQKRTCQLWMPDSKVLYSSFWPSFSITQRVFCSQQQYQSVPLFSARMPAADATLFC